MNSYSIVSIGLILLTLFLPQIANNKLLWKYIKAKQQDNTGITTLKGPDGEPITESLDKLKSKYLK